MVLPTVMIIMALFSSLPSFLVIFGLFFAWLADAQTETIYLTQTVFTACDCSASLSSSTVSFLMPSIVPVSSDRIFLIEFRN